MSGWPALGVVFESRRARAAAFGYAAAIVAIDYWLIHRGGAYVPRFLLATVAVLVSSHLAMRDPRGPDSLGWRRLPPDERRAWAWAIAITAAAVVVAIAVAVIIARVRGAPLWRVPPLGSVLAYASWPIVVWPIYEEMIYRLALLPAAVAAFGRVAAFAIGAAAFAYLHVLYGNFDPSNAFGSVMLTLVFLRTGSVLLTIGLHAGGNAAIVAANLAMYWFA